MFFLDASFNYSMWWKACSGTLHIMLQSVPLPPLWSFSNCTAVVGSLYRICHSQVKVRPAVCTLKIKSQDNAWLDWKINICWGGLIGGGHWWDLFFFFFLELVFWILQLIILLIYLFSGRRAAGWGLSQTCRCGHTSGRGKLFHSMYWYRHLPVFSTGLGWRLHSSWLQTCSSGLRPTNNCCLPKWTCLIWTRLRLLCNMEGCGKMKCMSMKRKLSRSPSSSNFTTLMTWKFCEEIMDQRKYLAYCDCHTDEWVYCVQE